MPADYPYAARRRCRCNPSTSDRSLTAAARAAQRGLIATIVALLLMTATAAQAAVSEAEADALQQAQQDYQAGDYAEAVERLEDMIENNPALAEAYRLLGFAHYQLDDHEAARAAFVQALNRGRLTADQLGRLVQIDEAAGRTAALLNTLRLLSVLEPDEPDWQHLYAHKLAEAGAAGEAALVLRRLREADPADADAHLRLGRLYLEQGRLVAAAQAWETAYHLGTPTAELAENLAATWREQEQPTAARVWQDRAVAITAEPAPTMLLRQAELLLADADADAAAEIARRLTDDADADAAVHREAHALLARIAIGRDEPDTAADHWRQAVDAGLDEPDVLAFLGAHHFNAGRYREAAGFLSRAPAGGEDRETSRFLVLSHIRSGEADHAADALRHHLERFGLDDASRRLIAEWAD